MRVLGRNVMLPGNARWCCAIPTLMVGPTRASSSSSDRARHHFRTDRVRADEPGRPVLLGRTDGNDDRGGPLKICFHLLPGAELELHGYYLAAAGDEETDLPTAVTCVGRLT